jgi:hypothetical protein
LGTRHRPRSLPEFDLPREREPYIPKRHGLSELLDKIRRESLFLGNPPRKTAQRTGSRTSVRLTSVAPLVESFNF